MSANARRGRLIVIYRADPTGRYGWLGSARAGDIAIALDDLALADLAGREPIAFDALQSWQQRSADEHRVSETLRAIASHPAVAAIEHHGLRLIEFAEYRLRGELVRLLRGWTLARAAAAVHGREPICDPALGAALAIGVRAGLGLDVGAVEYVLPAALAGSRWRRALAQQLMSALASVSRAQRVRVAVVAAGKLSLAVGALSDAELRDAGVGLLPFPGLDHGNGLLLALRKRRPLLGSLPRARAGRGAPLGLPMRLRILPEADLDRALTVLVGHVLNAAAPELEQATRALRGLDARGELRALLLPSAAYGASRLLIDWAHQRGLRVGAMQHGIYSFREFDGGDGRADVICGWGEATGEQIARWPPPRPRVHPVGVPGLAMSLAPLVSSAPLRRVLIATSSAGETPIVPVGFCEAFIATLAAGARRLARAGVEIVLRPHPVEEPERYRRLLRLHGLDVRVRVAAEGTFVGALADADLLIASASSVAFEAAARQAPVLLWLGPAPRWVRAEHLVEPWTQNLPGMFASADELCALVEDLLERPAAGLRVAHGLARELARYAEPFDAARFASALRMLGS